jgi:hypothetical protein
MLFSFEYTKDVTARNASQAPYNVKSIQPDDYLSFEPLIVIRS